MRFFFSGLEGEGYHVADGGEGLADNLLNLLLRELHSVFFHLVPKLAPSAQLHKHVPRGTGVSKVRGNPSRELKVG